MWVLCTAYGWINLPNPTKVHSSLTLCSSSTGNHVPFWMSSDLIKVKGAGCDPPPLPSVQNIGWAISIRCDKENGYHGTAR